VKDFEFKNCGKYYEYLTVVNCCYFPAKLGEAQPKNSLVTPPPPNMETNAKLMLITERKVGTQYYICFNFTHSSTVRACTILHFLKFHNFQASLNRRVNAWDRCYDFLNIFAEKISEKIGVFDSKQS
jgi:hypothetical protein